jgi:hypothetical protein
MLYHDAQGSRELAGERHAELKHDWHLADAATPAPVEARSDRRARLAWLRAQLRTARRATARHAA